MINRLPSAISDKWKRILRHTLGLLLAFVAINAFAGGYYAIWGAQGVPIEWLQGTPFKDYFIPGMVLFGIIGGAFLLAAIAVSAQLRIARSASLIAVGLLFFWLAVQLSIIGYVSWMQPTTAIVAFAILFITLQLRTSKQDGAT